MRRVPQVLVNVPVARKPAIETVPELAVAIRRAESLLGDRGRVLVRYSGTEALLRVMVEGEHEAQIQELADTMADAARRRLGSEPAAAAEG
jgi:phosphoglucosamine mutase